MTILLVDDETEILDLYARYLRRCGFPDITVAHTSQGAIDAMAKSRPDLIILDISLGANSEGTGMDVLSAAVKTCPLSKICMMSAYRDEHEQLSLEGGAHAFIAKPFKPEVLLELIRSFEKARGMA